MISLVHNFKYIGKSAKLQDSADIDWVPTLHLTKTNKKTKRNYIYTGEPEELPEKQPEELPEEPPEELPVILIESLNSRSVDVGVQTDLTIEKLDL